MNNYFANNMKGGLNFIGGNLYDFFNNASVNINNKYYVILYGQLIDDCVNELSKTGYQHHIYNGNVYGFDVRGSSNPTMTMFQSLSKDNGGDGFFVKTDTGKYVFVLKWSCKSITIPDMSYKANNSVNLDFNASGRDYMLSEIEDGDISLELIDNSNMGLTHIFKTMYNILSSSAINNKHAISKVRSSFRKLHMFVFSAGGLKSSGNSEYRESLLNYNSFQNLTLKNISLPPLSYEDNKISNISVSFYCPIITQKMNTVSLSQTELVSLMIQIYQNKLVSIYGLDSATDMAFYNNKTNQLDERNFYELGN